MCVRVHRRGGSAESCWRGGVASSRRTTASSSSLAAEKGRYVRNHHRLDVQPTGRYLLNEMLTGCMAKAVRVADTGLQD